MRELQFKPERDSLRAFMAYMFKEEKGKPFDDNWHYKEIEDALLDVFEGRCNRLIINIPPGHGKTELITKCFPVWMMGKRPDSKIIATGYSAQLTQQFGAEARDYYRSASFRRVFPRAPRISEDTDAKGHWKNTEGGSYYATGTGGSITGLRANIFLIDDPLKPDEANSDLKREAINSWYSNTVTSRLFNPLKDAVIIIMQRLHEADLCGYLMDRENRGLGEKWRKIILPAIAETDEPNRKKGEALFPQRFPIEALRTLEVSLHRNFSSQYQQDPVDKLSQEFHEEWWKYYEVLPIGGRTFTAVDPAFSVKDSADESSVCTVRFYGDEAYICEITHGRFGPTELENEITRHALTWRPEKIGIEAVQAQVLISHSLKSQFASKGISSDIEEIRQGGADKETRIRRLIPMYHRGQIWHLKGAEWSKALESQLIKFPRAKHDDIPDSLQMVYDLYTLQPRVRSNFTPPKITYDSMGRPKYE